MVLWLTLVDSVSTSPICTSVGLTIQRLKQFSNDRYLWGSFYHVAVLIIPIQLGHWLTLGIGILLPWLLRSDVVKISLLDNHLVCSRRVQRFSTFVSSLLKCYLEQTSSLSLCKWSFSFHLRKLNPVTSKVLNKFYVNTFVDSMLPPSPMTSSTLRNLFEIKYGLRLILLILFQVMFYGTFEYK